MYEVIESRNETRATPMQVVIADYSQKLARALALDAMNHVSLLAEALREAWVHGRVIYLCGNGGSAGNAIHLANDLLFGAGCTAGKGPARPAVRRGSRRRCGSGRWRRRRRGTVRPHRPGVPP